MSYISAYGFSFDVVSQTFTSDADFYFETYIDPETGEYIDGYIYWDAYIDGVNVSSGSSGYATSYEYVYDIFYNGLPTGLSNLSILATGGAFGGEYLELNIDVQNHTLAEFGQLGFGYNEIPGASNIDVVFGSDYSDDYRLGQNDDYIEARGGNDSVKGGSGFDRIFGGTGGDHLWGGAGGDDIDGGSGFDYARYDDADHGNLTIYLNASYLNVGAAAEGDYYTSIEGVVGGVGHDFISGSSIANRLLGGDGNDDLRGGRGNDTLEGGIGSDHIYGGLGADQVIGGAGFDYVRYGDGDWGDLFIHLGASNLNTGTAAAGDTYSGIEGVVGGFGNDRIYGTGAANRILGNDGNDIIDGFGGMDTLEGGAGLDDFRFSTGLGSSNVDSIVGFQHGVDDILLKQSIFTGIGPTLSAGEFGTAPGAGRLIIYNAATGALSYDAGGSGTGPGPVVFATVAVGTVLDINDFVMV